MKAIVIDPENKTVTEVDYSGDYKDIYKLIGCRTFDIVRIPTGLDGIYIDDEGLYAEKQAFWKFWFSTTQMPIKLVNKGLVLGCNDEGDTIAPDSTVEDIKKNITWEW
jgi:hypothetical protein